jgi:hypothetical protein
MIQNSLFVGSASADSCVFDVATNKIVCWAHGEDDADPSGALLENPGKRYVHTAIDPGIGDCHYWSNVPGGLDAWDPANDPAVIATVTRLPLCPVIPAVDVEVRAWEVFRSWDLDHPAPTLTPPDAGITGLPTHLATATPITIVHSEVLPDGRTLDVRAAVVEMAVLWGDGDEGRYDPAGAVGHPEGTVWHSYALKTCPADYRAEHPSGHLCHPGVERYTITSTFVWMGEYSLGGAWIPLGTIDTTTAVDYDVDEARGVATP